MSASSSSSASGAAAAAAAGVAARSRAARSRAAAAAATGADVGDEVTHGLLLEELGEQTGPVRFELQPARRDDGADLVSRHLLTVVVEDESRVRAREITRHFISVPAKHHLSSVFRSLERIARAPPSRVDLVCTPSTSRFEHPSGVAASSLSPPCDARSPTPRASERKRNISSRSSSLDAVEKRER